MSTRLNFIHRILGTESWSKRPSVSPKDKLREASSRDELKENPGKKSPHSPFNIRRVKPVKPEKIVIDEKKVKKKTKRKKSSSIETKMDHSSTSESRMTIRRDRNRGIVRLVTTDPRNVNVYERLLRKKHSEPTGPSSRFYNKPTEDDTTSIEDRRRRIKSIQDSYPKVSNSFRSLSVSTQNALKDISVDDVNNTSKKNKEIKEEEDHSATTKDSYAKRREWISRSKEPTESSMSRSKQTEIFEAEDTGLVLLQGHIEDSDSNNTQTAIQLTKYETAGSSSNKDNGSNNKLNLTINLQSDKSGNKNSDIESQKMSRSKRSQSMKDPTATLPSVTRKSSHSPSARKTSYDLNDSLPDLLDTPKTPNNSADRLKRDYHLSDVEILSLRVILKKADLYEQSVRDRMFKVLKIDDLLEDDSEQMAVKVMNAREVESLKQKLFMSRKELDSYISFTKKMEREKRQSISEKEELETKIQWHERRLTRFETENKSLKTERANMMNQIYELKGKSSTYKESGHIRQKSMDSSLVTHQPELEISKQRLIYEADAFAQERTKLIKERQRLDEEVRKVQIRCVSLLAQLQHSEKTVEELKVEKEQLKAKIAKLNKQYHEEARKLQEQLANAEESFNEAIDKREDRLKHRKEYSSFIESMKQDDNEIAQLQNDLIELEKKFDTMRNEFRNAEECRIRLDHENMALKDTVNVIQNAKEDALTRLNEMDVKYREALGELKAITVASEDFENERSHLRKDLEDVSFRLSELQHDAVNMEADQDAFKKFLDKLSMELQEKLGEEHVSKDTEAETLQEQADIIGRQIVAHLNPARKLQDDYEAIKQDKDDLEEEIRYLKFALANRLEIKSMQLPKQNCECSKEKNALKRELEDAFARLESLDSEVNRLHQDKQQLLMSFLNLQASQRSREVSKSDVGMTTDDDLSDDNEDTETERESDDGTDSRSFSSSNPSINTIKVGNPGPVAGHCLTVPLGPSRARSSDNIHKQTIDEELNDLKAKLQETIKTKERLETERVEMLDSLCIQVETNNVLKAEIEDLKLNGPLIRPNSRPGSSISKSDSSSSLSQDKCSNCCNYSEEIRSYLSIIEELTEDKLRLEKSEHDLESDRDQLKVELERQTEMCCKIESELSVSGSVNENSLKAAKEESHFLLQNIQSLEQENSVLEENLRKLREDKTEILDNLRQGEEDRFGFIRTLQLITEQKENIEIELNELKKENEELKLQVKVQGGGR